MPRTREKDVEPDRRVYLKLAGVTGAVRATPSASTSDDQNEMATGSYAGGRYEFFKPEESAFVEAAVDTLIPADAAGPGAIEVGVAAYIDRQMASNRRKRDATYFERPSRRCSHQRYKFVAASEVLRTGIKATNDHTLEKYNRTFESLSSTERVAVVAELDAGKVKLPSESAELFFRLLLQLTIEGYFADSLPHSAGVNGNGTLTKQQSTRQASFYEAETHLRH